MQIEFFEGHGEQVHDISYVQIEDPVVLILHTEDGLYIVFQLRFLRQISV